LALLVDDEELVRLSTCDMLRELGYEVIEAACAEEALKLVRGGLEPDLIVTDHLMPGMSGTDLAHTVLAERPELKFLIVSGYADASGVASELPLLTKPFRLDELATRVVELSKR
jgi:CheY-like chemotaxis protein